MQTSEIVFFQAVLYFYLRSVNTYMSLTVRSFYDMQSIAVWKDIPTPIVMWHLIFLE